MSDTPTTRRKPHRYVLPVVRELPPLAPGARDEVDETRLRRTHS